MNDPIGPIFKVEIEGIKSQVLQVLQTQNINLSSYVEKSFDNFEETLQPLIDKTVKDCMTEQIEFFFKYGKGRDAIVKGIEQQFKQETASDEEWFYKNLYTIS